MKIRIYFIIALVIAISSAGCKKQIQPFKPEASNSFSASLEDSSGAFSAIKSTTNIVIIAGTNGWSITQGVANNWCVPDKNYGAGDYKLRITLNANTTGIDRSTQIKLVSTNSSLKPVLLNISQTK